MSKATMIAVIVLSTIECLINGEKVKFLPSDEPQKIPKADSDEAIERGLAKLPTKTSKPRETKPKSGNTGSDSSGSGDDSDDQDDLENKDQVGV